LLNGAAHRDFGDVPEYLSCVGVIRAISLCIHMHIAMTMGNFDVSYAVRDIAHNRLTPFAPIDCD
jgi:hypothetical protein